MGSEDFYPEERPVHRRTVKGLWMDHHPVTNAEFRRFVKDTGHITTAETAPLAADFPDASDDQLVPGSLVFTPPDHPVPLHDYRAWWSCPRRRVAPPRRTRLHPARPRTTPRGPRQPRRRRGVHELGRQGAAHRGRVEYAARGGLDGATYAWGDTPRCGAGSWPTPGTAGSRTRTSTSTGTSAPHRSGHSRRTDTAWSMCAATSGSGPPATHPRPP